MAGRGGRREGAGRKKGSKSKSTVANEKLRERLIEQGLTPLDYFTRIMQDKNEPQEVRLQAANMAAPYVHPRLSAHKVALTDERELASLEITGRLDRLRNRIAESEGQGGVLEAGNGDRTTH